MLVHVSDARKRLFNSMRSQVEGIDLCRTQTRATCAFGTVPSTLVQ